MAQLILDGLLGLRESSPHQPLSPARVTLDTKVDQCAGVRDADTIVDVTLTVQIGEWVGRAAFSSYAGLFKLLADDLMKLHHAQHGEAALDDWDSQETLWFRAVPDHPDWIVLSGQAVLFADASAEDEPLAAPFEAMDTALSGESSMAIVFRSVRIDRCQLPALANGILAMLRDEGITWDGRADR